MSRLSRPNRPEVPVLASKTAAFVPVPGRDSVYLPAKSGRFADADAASHMKLHCVAQKCHDMSVRCHNPKG
jgi:hypothetical protein